MILLLTWRCDWRDYVDTQTYIRISVDGHNCRNTFDIMFTD